MKVAHVININAYGGAENLLTSLLLGLKSEGVDTCCLILCPRGNNHAAQSIKKELELEKITVYLSEYKSLLSPSNFSWISKTLKYSNADLAHCHLRYADIWLSGLKIFRQISIPFVTTVHGYNDSYMNSYGLEVSAKMKRSLYYRITKWVTRKSEGLIFISACMKDFYLRAGFTGNVYNEIIYHGYESQDQAKIHTPEVEVLIAPKLVLAGRVIKRKGHAYAVDALQHILKRYPDAKLHLLGTGPFEGELHQLIEKAGLQESVVFEGYQKEIVKSLIKFDIALLPSYWEPFGVVFLDAFAAGIPVVAFDLPAGNEIVKDQYNGLLALPYDSLSLAEKVADLANSATLRRELTENAGKDLKERFSLKRMATEYKKFYIQVLSNRK